MAFSAVSFAPPLPIFSHRFCSAKAVPASLTPLRRNRNIVVSMASNEVSSLTMKSKNNVVRPVIGNYSPSLWDDLLSSSNVDILQSSDMYAEEIEVLKKEARNMLMISGDNSKLSEKLVLIDTIERLGLSYHFENEIQQQLTLAFNGHFKLDPKEYDDLFIVSLQFRLLRQRGFDAPSSIFERFTENNGEFKKALLRDIGGLLSVYEASYLRREGEEILDKAFSFSKAHLESVAPNLPESPLKKQVLHALGQSLLRGTPRIEARRFISLYEEVESNNESLLRLAKLDFNSLQMLHKKEVCELNKWWKEMDLASKLPYIRDRVVECYFWALGIYYEPQYSDARIMQAKLVAILSVIDDTFDSYGTVEELEVFTKAVQKWDMSEIGQLPDYMKISYRALMELFEALDAELSPKGRSFAVDYSREATKEIVRNYYTEAKWFLEGHFPEFDEYMRVSMITIGYYCVTIYSFLGMNNATIEVFNWFSAKPKIVQDGNLMARILDDIGTYESEKEQGKVTTGIDFYMKEKGVSRQVATQQLHEIAETGWKGLNEGMRDKSVSFEILTTIFNWARVAEITYKGDEDGYVHPEKRFKAHVIALLFESIKI